MPKSFSGQAVDFLGEDGGEGGHRKGEAAGEAHQRQYGAELFGADVFGHKVESDEDIQGVGGARGDEKHQGIPPEIP